MVITSTDRVLPREEEEVQAQTDGTDGEGQEDDEDEESQPEVKIAEEMAEFEDIMVWGHEALQDGTDPYIKGIEEWIKFAEQVHTTPVIEHSNLLTPPDSFISFDREDDYGKFEIEGCF